MAFIFSESDKQNLKILTSMRKQADKFPYDISILRDLMDFAELLGRDDPVARSAAALVKERVVPILAKGAANMDELGRVRLEQSRALLFSSHYDVDSYFQFLEWERDPMKRFYLPRRQQLTPLINGFQLIVDDEIDLLTVSQPPGTGKSAAGTYFMTMQMGLRPDMYNVISAYSDSLTRMFFSNILYMVSDDSEYNWNKIFPNTALRESSAKDTTIDVGERAPYPTLTCKPIGGTLTGRVRCSNILYADDLVSGIEEAMNKDRLDKLWQSYTNDLKSRTVKGYKEINVATRWSVHDPIGRLQNRYDDNPRARFVVMPALDENDESNFDYKYDLGFSTAHYHDIRSLMDDASWNSLYMNEPYEREGLVYKEDELRRYFELPVDETGVPIEPDAIISIVDTKDTGKDYAFMPVAYVYGEDFYIEDLVLSNGLPELVEADLVLKLRDHKVNACRFESNSAGGRIADKVRSELMRFGGITNITKKFTTANKETKILVHSPWVKEHCLFKDKTTYAANSDYAKMIRFLCSYTLTGKNQVDDVPDGMAMLASFAQSFMTKSIEIFKSPIRR